MPNLEEQIVTALARKNYQPLKPKALARKLGIPSSAYGQFRSTLRDLLKQHRIEIGKNHTVRPVQPHGTVVGIYRKTSTGTGFVRPHAVDGNVGPEIMIRPQYAQDASTGDEVLVRITRKPSRPDLGPAGEILKVLERATRRFVGTYFEREGEGLVRVDGTVFSHSIFVGDPGAKGVRPDDKVVIEMLRFPSPEDRGEGVITEVLGPRGKPEVDTLSVIRAFDLPDQFPEEVLAEAREQAEIFREDDLDGRKDLTKELTITIDPVDARDFDDAISLTQDSRTKHWQLGVHIADVAHFAPPASALDREARKRGTSVYLPRRVLPMFPEIISNSLASLQQGRVRYVKSALMDFTPAGQRTESQFANAAIRVRRRFTYEQVSAILQDPEGKGSKIEPEILSLLLHARDFAMNLRRRRLKRGAIELNMPEAELEFDEQGRVSGAHFVKHDISHQIIEEFMLAANEAVAEHLDDLGVPFLRRVHPPPEPTKLEAFADFANSLGYKIDRHPDRFALQRVLEKSADKPDVYAVHYSLLRSLKQARYSPEKEEHYALASQNYCHFTSPIRRYPDLTVHRLLDQWLRTGRAGSDETELAALGEHCSKTERRAEMAERELIKVKLLDYLSQRIGIELEVIITGVADYGFFAQAEELPVEGLVHVSTLTDDYYHFDETSHSLIGRRTHRRYRLGDKVKVNVVRVDQQRRQLDFRVVAKKKGSGVRSRVKQ
ncbi:MAG TPA: ribonuclease R [Gemmataceae bacterium]|nr:ribonuclease R [Gemmataceae bacterium]